MKSIQPELIGFSPCLDFKLNNMTDLRKHWHNFWSQRYAASPYATNYGLHIYNLEALASINQLKQLNFTSNLRVLSIGTGLGQVEINIIQNLPSLPRIFVAADLIESVLRKFQLSTQNYASECVIAPVACSGYKLPYADNTFDLALSFGRACVASYNGVAPEVVRVVKPGGIVIMDFINHLSIYDIMRWRNYRRFLAYCGMLSGAGGKYTHFGQCGIRRTYGQLGLDLKSLIFLASVPPLGPRFSVTFYERIERVWPLKQFFSRVLLATFMNCKR